PATAPPRQPVADHNAPLSAVMPSRVCPSSANTASWFGVEVPSQVPAVVQAAHRLVIGTPAGTHTRAYHRFPVMVLALVRNANGSPLAASSPYPDSGKIGFGSCVAHRTPSPWAESATSACPSVPIPCR